MATALSQRRPLGELEARPLGSASRTGVSRPTLPFADSAAFASPGSRALALEQSQDASAALDADTDSEPGASSPQRQRPPARAASSSALLDAFRASSLSPAKEPARSQSARQSPTALNSAARLQSALGAGGAPFSQSPASSSGRSGAATPSSLPRTPGGQINVIALTASAMTLDEQPSFAFFTDADPPASGPASPPAPFADDEELMAIDEAVATAEQTALESKENAVPARPPPRLGPLASASRRGSTIGSGSPLARPPLALPTGTEAPRPSTPPMPPSPAGSELAAARAAKRVRRDSS